jgi:hypothetical protein
MNTSSSPLQLEVYSKVLNPSVLDHFIRGAGVQGLALSKPMVHPERCGACADACSRLVEEDIELANGMGSA